MKSIHLLFITLAFLLTGCGASSSSTGSDGKSSKEEKRAAEYDNTVALVDSGNYEYTLKSASPMGGRTIQITSTYTLDVKDGVYKAYLPYYGRAFNASYGGDGGVDFEGEPEDLSIVKNADKRTITVSFSIKNDNELYDCTLVIGSSGNGTLTIASSNRQTISYYGVVSKLTEPKKKKEKE